MKSTSVAQPQGGQDDSKSDCKKFVDEIVKTAEMNEGWKSGPDVRQGMSTGGDLVDKFVPPGGGLNALTRDLLGNIPGTQKDYIGLDGTSGFRSELTQGGQGVAVGRHVVANAALSLNYVSWIGTPIANALDRAQRESGNLESAAEIAGNIAGQQVGYALRSFHHDVTGSQELKSSLMGILCDE